MMRLLLVFFLIGVSGGAFAQQPPEDPRIGIWRQLYLEVSDRMVGLGAQATALAQENTSLKAELAKLKNPKPVSEKKP